MEKLLGDAMRCEMPNCENDGVVTVSKTGLFHGIVSHGDICVCENHDVKEINEEIEELCKEKAIDMQLCNPFVNVSCKKKSEKIA